jgi:excisionase family DNA binding protein
MKTSFVPRPDVGPAWSESCEYLDKRQVAHRLGVSVRTIDTLMKARKVPYLKLTRKLVRFRRQDVDDYLARHFRIKAVGE